MNITVEADFVATISLDTDPQSLMSVWHSATKTYYQINEGQLKSLEGQYDTQTLAELLLAYGELV